VTCSPIQDTDIDVGDTESTLYDHKYFHSPSACELIDELIEYCALDIQLIANLSPFFEIREASSIWHPIISGSKFRQRSAKFLCKISACTCVHAIQQIQFWQELNLTKVLSLVNNLLLCKEHLVPLISVLISINIFSP